MSRRCGWLPVLAVAFGALVVSCNPLSGPLPGGSVDVPAVQLVPYTGNFSYTVDPGTEARDVYFVFTNTSLTSAAQVKPSVDDSVIRVDTVKLPVPVPQPLCGRYSTLDSASRRIAEMNRDPYSALGVNRVALNSTSSTISPGSPSFDTVDDTDIFTDLGASNSMTNKPATCRFVSPTAVSVPDGSTRILNIWVADNCWDGADIKKHEVTPPMVDALAAKFLTAGVGNDIYDWVTAILGAEWGDTGDLSLIPYNGEITILLSDIEEDDSDNGGIVGYFYAANNFTEAVYSQSNERIMFVIDAVMFANPNDNGSSVSDGTVWAVTDYWAEVTFSTLAHEFQHMIQFYQKAVLTDAARSADVWINEMCSLVTEDLVADKLGVGGPRGVTVANGGAGSPDNTEGRIPLFNRYSYLPLVVLSSSQFDLYQYSVSYAFGAWIARAYGGSELLRRLVRSSETDSRLIVSAIESVTGQEETFAALLQKWSVSVLLSSLTNAPAKFRYNTGGWFTFSTGGETYYLGSINFFNYTPSLHVFSASGDVPNTTFHGSSNVYFLAAVALDEPKTWAIETPDGIGMSVVVK